MRVSTFEEKVGLAEMLKGGVIMDVTNADQARIAEKAGAVAVMALERIPSDIRSDGGIARMSDPVMIKEIQSAGFELVDFSDLHYRPDDELRYEVGRKTVTGNTDRFTLKFRKVER